MSEQQLIAVLNENLDQTFPKFDDFNVSPVIVRNTLGVQNLDYKIGPIHVYGTYEIFPPSVNLKVDVTVFGQSITIGEVHGTQACLGKDYGIATVKVCLEIKTDGIYLEADILSFHYNGKIVAWPTTVYLEPCIATPLQSLTQPHVEGREYLNVTLRNPTTHEATGFHLATASISKGTEIEEHFHHSDIIHVCVKGKIEWVINGKTLVTEQGDVIQIPANTNYSVLAKEDSTTVAGCVIVYW